MQEQYMQITGRQKHCGRKWTMKYKYIIDMKTRLTNALMKLVTSACISFWLNDWNRSQVQGIGIEFHCLKFWLCLKSLIQTATLWQDLQCCAPNYPSSRFRLMLKRVKMEKTSIIQLHSINKWKPKCQKTLGGQDYLTSKCELQFLLSSRNRGGQARLLQEDDQSRV